MLSKKPTELEQAVLDAIKLQLIDTFKKVSISCALEEREVVIRISIPDDIMQEQYKHQEVKGFIEGKLSDLDVDAQRAAKELLGEE